MSEDRGHRLLTEGIASTLRIGTILAIGSIGIGYVLDLLAGSPGPGPRPVVELVGLGGAPTFLALGLLGLALVPVAVLSVAIAGFAFRGETRMRNLAAAVTLLLVGTLVVALLIGSPPV